MKAEYYQKIVQSLIISILLFSCNEKQDVNKVFRSNFSSSQARTWIGPEYWANPMQDWQIENGELQCLVSKKNRNVHVLTKKLDTVSGSLNMQVNLKVFNFDTAEKETNWVGYSVGSKGEFNDYRDSAVFGKGLNVGVTTNGNLFIIKLPKNDTININVQRSLKSGVNLKVAIAPQKDGYELIISILENDTNKVISQLSKNHITSSKIVGDLVLVSNYVNNSDKKSVSFKNWKISGSKIKTENENKFGPILFSQYTLSKGIMKLTAQMAPVILNEENVRFQLKDNETWKTIKELPINKDSRTATFKIEKWNTKSDTPYRLAYKIDRGNNMKEEFYWEGIIRKDPIDKDEIVVAGFTGNNDLGFPNSDITSQVKLQDPDILFFSGDQIYEPVGGYGTQRFPIETAILDYLRKWYIYGWAYRDLLKDRPTVTITDDHDVYQGNIWGESGEHSPTESRQGRLGQDAGGYMMPAKWVNMVERTQTSHLPDPFDSTPVKQGIGTYYTDMVYGGISFAILEDRKFKSAPIRVLPKANIINGWPQNKSFSAKDFDVPSAKLLGKRQLVFLESWVSDWSYNAQMKILLSQTIFANVATLPKEAMSDVVVPNLRILSKGQYPENDYPVTDMDSNGWPQTGRDKAVETIRKGFAFHLAGDQHLGSSVQYGVDNFGDGGHAFCVPSISNYWPRRWYPIEEGQNRKEGTPKYTGDYEDGFKNKITVNAISNPLFTNKKPSKLYDRAAGYGIVRFHKDDRTITVECWPRGANIMKGNSEQYEGWPITINQEDNYGRKAKGYLPKIEISGLNNPVIQIINERTSNIIYTIRLNKNTYIPKIFDVKATYTIKVGEPDTNTWLEKNNIKPSYADINFNF